MVNCRVSIYVEINDPRVSINDPRVSINDPRVSINDPRVSINDPMGRSLPQHSKERTFSVS